MLELGFGSVMLLVGALLFANAVERLGEELGLTRFATGAVLAAAITALPETALALGSPLVNFPAAEEVGAGSVIAAPSITLLAAAPLVMLLSRRSLGRQLALSYLAFALLLPAPIAVGLLPVPRSLKLLGGLIMVAAYAGIGRHFVGLAGERMSSEGPGYFEKLLGRTSRAGALAQAALGTLMMYRGADLFLYAAASQLEPFTVALVISPFATCMEETLIAIWWALRGKADLGLSLLSGENLIQATFVMGVGMVATGWALPLEAAVALLLYLAAALAYGLSYRAPWPMPSLLGLSLYAAYMWFNVHSLLPG